MSRRNWLNLGLLILVAVLVLVVVYEPGKEKPQTVTLTELEPGDIEHIRIQRRQAPDIELVRQDGQWHMQLPYEMPANDFKVDELLRLAEATSHARRDLATLDKGKFGLDTIEASITFNRGAPLQFGGTEPLNHRRYVAYRGTLHLITDTFYYQLGRAATDFLDKALVPGEHNITALYLPELQLQLSDTGWQLQPAAEPVSNDRINELVENWQHAQALNIEPWEADTEKTQGAIRIERGELPALEYIILSREPEFRLARSDKGLQYQLPADRYRDLMQLPPKVDTPAQTAPPAEAGEGK